jgi:peptide/nickel transport system substrate-binding protein
MRPWRRRGYRRLAALLAWLSAAACAGEGGGGEFGADGAVAQEDRFGGTLVIGRQADLQSMNSLTTSDAVSQQVQQYLLFMPLVLYGADRVPHPWLAERWDATPAPGDSLDVVFHLRRDVSWHDGVPLTASDVLFTYERLLDPRTGSPSRALFDLWGREAEAIDSFSVRFRLRDHEEFLSGWNTVAIMPRHLLGDVPAEEMARHTFGQTQPVGSGPFRFVRRTPGQDWVFEANPNFPAALGGRPHVDRVVLRIIPDATTLLTEFLAGGIDAYTPVPPAHVSRIEDAPGRTVLSAPYRSYVYIGWNTRDPLFSDARVRRALNLTIDRRAIVDALLYGHGEAGVSTSTPLHWIYDDRYRDLAVEPDLDRARRLLAEAGWTPGPDGVLRDGQGRRFQFALVTSQASEVYRDVGPIVQAQLRQVGIAADPRTLEWNTLIAMLDGTPEPGGGRRRDFQAVTAGWSNEFRKDDAPLFHSRNANGPYAETGFSDPRTDALLDSLEVATDRERARAMWQEYHRILIEEAPYTTLFYPNILLAHRDRVRGVALDIRGPFAEVRNWWIHPEGRN